MRKRDFRLNKSETMSPNRTAKLPGFVPYDLRHTFASLLLSSNAPLLYVSRQLGHAKATTTLDHYAKGCRVGNSDL